MGGSGRSRVTMSDQRWVLAADGSFLRGRCRIEPIPGPNGGWILEVVPWGQSRVRRSTHPTLTAAKAWADHHERLATRRANRLRHGLASVLCGVAWVYLTFLLGPHGASGRVAVFAAAVVLFFLALHEMVELLDSTVPGDASDRRSRAAVPADLILETAALRWSAGSSIGDVEAGSLVAILPVREDDSPR